MDYRTFTLRLLLTLVIICENVNSAGIMGPASVVFKYLEKCKWTSPKLIDIDARIHQRKGKLVINVNATLPFPISDELGYDMNMAVKRSGRWISNFLQFKGKGVCTGVMKGEKTIFDMFAKDLKQPEPYHCPLPAGSLHTHYEGSDPSATLKAVGLEVMPYGEFKVSANLTRKDDVIACFKVFIDLVPKKGKSG